MSDLSPFQQVAHEIGNLVTEKNAAYGDSWRKAGEFLFLLYPNGVKPEQYTDMLLVVRAFDKLMRIATNKDALGESPWRDLGGYALLGATLAEESLDFREIPHFLTEKDAPTLTMPLESVDPSPSGTDSPKLSHSEAMRRIDWGHYPVRKATAMLNLCAVCSRMIEKGDRYCDGSVASRRAHASCAGISEQGVAA